MKSRAFVCDPVCANSYGHNVVGLKYFSDAVRPYFNKVIPFASKELPAEIAERYGFETGFEFYYHEHIPLESANGLQKGKRIVRGGGDDTLQMAIHDVASIFEKFEIGADDSIVFPCVDYYGAMGVLDVLTRLPTKSAPTVYFRFIGVMENATAIGVSGLPRLLKQITKMLSAGYEIQVCAETPRYADYLALELDTVVSSVPYPTHAELIAVAEDDLEEIPDSFTIICPGSARLDKGFLLLRDIFASVRKIDPQQTIKFVTQALPVADSLQHTYYTNQLYAIPGVKILPGSIPEAQMNQLYEQADLVLLPYDANTYAYRGSAVFMECISRGVPVICSAGPAFCDQVSYYGGGSVVSSADGFLHEILRYREMSKKDIYSKMAQARHRYTIDTDSAFSNWIS